MNEPSNGLQTAGPSWQCALNDEPQGQEASTVASWYVGFTCVECGDCIPVIRGGATEEEEFVANPLNVMCPACGTLKRYYPADARRFHACGSSARGIGLPAALHGSSPLGLAVLSSEWWPFPLMRLDTA
jgi:hypothetical protein